MRDGHSDAGTQAPRRLADAYRETRALFERESIETAALDARLLIGQAAGLTLGETIANRDQILAAPVEKLLAAFVNRRLAGEPVSRIIGRREFWGLSFELSPHTLDPRPETELLVETVLTYVQDHGIASKPLRILDLGTGSGCLLAALLSELPLSHGVGLDRSQDALEVARENLRRLGLLPRAAFLCADWLDALGAGCFDIIVSNPPYIKTAEIEGLSHEVRIYDPMTALDGGGDGFQAYRQILHRALAVLRADGMMVFETGYNQARTVLDLMLASASSKRSLNAQILKDLSVVERVVAGVRQSPLYEPASKKKIGNSVGSG